MKKVLFGFVMILFIANGSYAQLQGQARLDSLNTELLKTKEDSTKVNCCNLIAWELKYINPDTAIILSEQAHALAKKINWLPGIAKSEHYLGSFNYIKGDYAPALVHYFKALDTWDKFLNKTKPDSAGVIDVSYRKSSTIGNIAMAYQNQGNHSKALDFYFKALKMDKDMGNKKGVARTLGNIGMVYYNQDDYPTALDYYFKGLKMSEELGNKTNIANNLNNIATVYKEQGDFYKALDYYFRALKINEESGNKNGVTINLGNIGVVYRDENNYSKALDYFFKALKMCEEQGLKAEMAANLGNIGNVYHNQTSINSQSAQAENTAMGPREKDSLFDKALNYYFEALEIDKEIENKNGIETNMGNIGAIYHVQKKYKEAGEYLNNALAISKEIGDKDGCKEWYYHLSVLDSAMGNYKSAHSNYKMYIFYRDSIFNEENTKKLTRTEMQYQFAKKEAAAKAENEKMIALNRAEIKRQTVIKNAAMGGIAVLIIAGLASFVFYKRRRDAEEQKKESDLKAEVSEIEMKALRSQMNPHFIFNSLNSISDYISRNDNKTADSYLTKFAKVMRMILENSEHKEVSLQQDLKALELYMQLESLRLKKKFNYEIRVGESVDAENTLIPPLILQPFVENSIWHGLAEKEGEGKISISIDKIGEMIECTVEDNGVGRKKSAEVKGGYSNVEKKSLGMKITNARIDILNKIKKSKAGVELVDLAEGMKVIVKLPLELSF